MTSTEVGVAYGVLTLLGICAVVGLIAWTYVRRSDRYGRNPKASSPHLHPTTEIFVDPESGKRQRVWYDPASGTREYRDEP